MALTPQNVFEQERRRKAVAKTEGSTNLPRIESGVTVVDKCSMLELVMPATKGIDTGIV